jgi:uncharacterized protein YyaL (SSP411 family)
VVHVSEQFLRQYGTVHWHEWSDEAFHLAKELDRPILLDISATWCHWCHVMDATSYTDPMVVDVIHRHYVPVRVDTDRRPDINERYNMGGWPTTAILTPTGDIIAGATYIPPEQMRLFLQRVADYYHRDKETIYTRILEARQRQASAFPSTPGNVDATIVATVLASLREHYDPDYGGFGSEPKFPHSDALELALLQYQRAGSQDCLAMVTHTLRSMAGGGIYDQEAGGWFRYSTTADWRIPHYEKMLEGNAGLLRNLLHTYRLTGDVGFRQTALSTVSYVHSTLADQERGGWAGSQDADEEYYALPLAERARRLAPSIDRTVYTNWNAQMASSYLLAGAILGDDHYYTFALKTLDWMMATLYRPGEGMYHFYDGVPHLPGLLADQAAMATALLDAYEVSGESRYLQVACDLVDYARRAMGNGQGGFYDSAERQGHAQGALSHRLMSLGDNSVMARAMIRLSYLTDDPTIREQAQQCLSLFVDQYERFGYFAAIYALAVDALVTPPVVITVVGQQGDARSSALLRAAHQRPELWKVVRLLDPVASAHAVQRAGYSVGREPVAYVCMGTTCLAPTTVPDQVIQSRLSA